MGENTAIEWAHHTCNLWWGCVHCSPACDHCYADAWANYSLPPGWLIIGEGRDIPRRTRPRDPDRPAIWGADKPRIFAPDGSPVMTDPLRWNRRAVALRERHRVFVSSMCDIFERHKLAEVNRMMDRRRQQFFSEIVPQCPWLDFLLLTKRPHDILRLAPEAWRTAWPQNVWVGCTVEDQQRAVQRLPHLVQVPAPVRFISVEPLLGPIDFAPWIGELDWVIVGGESGPAARPSDVAWVRSVREQVTSAGKSFFFKQWGNWTPKDGAGDHLVRLRTKNFRILDGREWNEIPVPRG